MALGLASRAQRVVDTGRVRAPERPEWAFHRAKVDLVNLQSRLGRGSPDLTRRICALLIRTGEQAQAEALLKPSLMRRIGDRTAARELALSALIEGKDAEALEA